jgi:hypothetical protein
MSVCPNSDPDFDKVLVNMVGNSLPDTRKKIFYLICIPVRFILYSLVYYYSDLTFMPFLVGIISLITAIRLAISLKDTGNQWWSKKWQFFISMILVIVCIFVYFKKIDSRSMSIVLFTSLLGGIIESLLINFC